jgi:hypothetical protein
MSVEARQKLVNSKSVFFQNNSQKSDLLDVHCVRTEIIALALELIAKGNILEFTAVKSDHHDDSYLGPFCHFNGAAFDCWPLVSHRAGDYADAISPQMQKFIRDVMASQWTAQCGLAGTADCQELIAAAGFITYPATGRLFPDDGADHIHVGAHYPQGLSL